MKLYGTLVSPFVRHCRIALLETGLDCELTLVDATISAEKSPTKKVPYFEDGQIFLSDSCAIVKYLREKSGGTFCHSAEEFDQLCAINTLMDATVNLFMLEKEGITPEQSTYLNRHAARVKSGLEAFDKLSPSLQAPHTDAELRLACFLDWGRFRNRFSLSPYKNLTTFLASMGAYPPFSATPPEV